MDTCIDGLHINIAMSQETREKKQHETSKGYKVYILAFLKLHPSHSIFFPTTLDFVNGS